MLYVNQKKWFYKRFSKKSNKIQLGFKNLYIFPNLFGINWIFATITLYILGTNLENNFTIFLSYLMTTVILISLFLTHFNLHGLKLSSIEQEIYFANNQIKYDFLISSKKIRNNLKIKFLDKSGKYIFLKNVYGKFKTSLLLNNKKRGIYSPDIIYGESSSPLSLFNCWFYWRPIYKIIIAPEIKKGAIIERQKSSKTGNKFIELKNGFGSEFKELSNYIKGEKKSLIYWKSYAKDKKLLIKSFKKESNISKWLEINKLVPLEIALKNLCSEIHVEFIKNNTYGIRLSDTKFIFPNCGNKHYLNCLYLLAEFKNEEL